MRDEAVHVTLILPIDEELVYALHVMLSSASNHQSLRGSTEVLVVGLCEVPVEP